MKSLKPGGRYVQLLESGADDIRLAWRRLTGAPGFSTAAVLMLGFGMAVAVTTFAGVKAGLQPPPGISDHDGLVRVVLGRPSPDGGRHITTTFRDFLELRERVPALSGLALAHYDVPFSASVAGQAVALRGQVVSANYFDVLRVSFGLGRGFMGFIDDEDPGFKTQPVVVISHAVWRRHFAGDSRVTEQEIRIDGIAMRILGVAPRGFRGIQVGGAEPDLWVPLGIGPVTIPYGLGERLDLRAGGEHWFAYIGRLRPGTMRDQAQREVASVARVLAAADPRRQGLQGTVAAFDDGFRTSEQQIARALALMGIPFVVLSLAWINTANLLLARAIRRADEWALRIAVGATGGQLARQLLLESLLIAALAALIGVLIALPTLRILDRQLQEPSPLVVDGSVLVFTAVTATITTLAFALGPALAISTRASGVGAMLRGCASMRHRAGPSLVGVQVALSLVLLTTGFQFVNTIRAAHTDVGLLDPQSVIIASFDLRPLDLPQVAGESFYDRLTERTAALPDVQAVALTNRFAIAGGNERPRHMAFRMWTSVDSPSEGEFVSAIHARGELPDVLNLPLLEGRDFLPSDYAGRPSHVLVTKALADRVFQGQRPAIGRTFEIAAFYDSTERVTVTVVGVIGPGVGVFAGPMILLPSALMYVPDRTMFIRLRPDARVDAAVLHQIVREIDSRVPIEGLASAREVLAQYDRNDILGVTLLLLIAVVAAILTATGLFAVLSFVLGTRVKELAVRIAVGATPLAVFGLVVRQSAVAVATGIALGAGGAAGAATILRSSLHGVSRVDPVAFVAASAMLLIVMAAVCVIPLARALRIDPIAALREQ